MRKFYILSVLVLVALACSTIAISPQVFERAISLETPVIPVTGSEGFEGCGNATVLVQNADFEQAIVEQTNAIRKQYDLPPLKRMGELNDAARYHAADMSVENYFSHDTYNLNDANLVLNCEVWSRLESYYKNWQAMGENIAAGQYNPESAMDGWMNSPDHKHNILSKDFWEIGVGFFQGGGDYRFYWVQDFGRVTGRYPLVIDGEKAVTSTENVSIYIYGTDWQSMRLLNDQGEWTPWIDFQNQFDWVLPNTPGQHTVTAQLRGKGLSTETEDTITLSP
jgi:uncharacterized protein YkwD